MAELDEIRLPRLSEITLVIFLSVCRVLSVIPLVIFLAIWLPIAVAPWIIVGPWRVINKIGRTRGIVARYRLERDLNG